MLTSVNINLILIVTEEIGCNTHTYAPYDSLIFLDRISDVHIKMKLLLATMVYKSIRNILIQQ